MSIFVSAVLDFKSADIQDVRFLDAIKPALSAEYSAFNAQLLKISLNCIFRGNPAGYSDGSRPPIPKQSGHSFRREGGHFLVVCRNRWPESFGMKKEPSRLWVISEGKGMLSLFNFRERRLRWQRRDYLCVRSERYCD